VRIDIENRHYHLPGSEQPLCGASFDTAFSCEVNAILSGAFQRRPTDCRACVREAPKVLRADYTPRTSPPPIKAPCDLEAEILKFITFYDLHKDGPPLELEGGVLQTVGCEPGTKCCSKTFDLEGLVDELRELVQ